jgi:hypothetical protein
VHQYSGPEDTSPRPAVASTRLSPIPVSMKRTGVGALAGSKPAQATLLKFAGKKTLAAPEFCLRSQVSHMYCCVFRKPGRTGSKVFAGRLRFANPGAPKVILPE